MRLVASVMAWQAEAHASVTVSAGVDLGRLAAKAQLAGEVGVVHGSGDVAVDDVLDLVGVEVGALQQFEGDGASELEDVEAGEVGSGAHEGRAQPGDDGGAAGRGHGGCCLPNVW